MGFPNCPVKKRVDSCRPVFIKVYLDRPLDLVSDTIPLFFGQRFKVFGKSQLDLSMVIDQSRGYGLEKQRRNPDRLPVNKARNPPILDKYITIVDVRIPESESSGRSLETTDKYFSNKAMWSWGDF